MGAGKSGPLEEQEALLKAGASLRPGAMYSKHLLFVPSVAQACRTRYTISFTMSYTRNVWKNPRWHMAGPLRVGTETLALQLCCVCMSTAKEMGYKDGGEMGVGRGLKALGADCFLY